MTDALRAEWTKLRTLAGTGWLLIGAVALTVGGQRRRRRRHPPVVRAAARTPPSSP